MPSVPSGLAILCLSFFPTLAWGQTHQILRRGQHAAVPATDPPNSLDRTASAGTAARSSGFPAISSTSKEDRQAAKGEVGHAAGPVVTVTSSLAVVLGLFAGLVWLTRKYGSRSLGQGALPKEVLQSLGSVPIDSRTRIAMLRCGHRILVVSQTPHGMQTLAEINDPEEVRDLTATCLGDSKKMFAATIESIGNEKNEQGFLDPPSSTPPARRPETPRDRGRLFATA